jgi:small GTP-binding protein
MKSFNILLLGDSNVGKTSFIDRYCGKDFNQNIATIGVESRIKDIVKNNNSIKLCIYDTAGQERYRKIVNNYYKGADGIILMYDVSNIDSFNAIRIWIESIKLNLEIQKIGFIVVENKCDLSEEEKKLQSK